MCQFFAIHPDNPQPRLIAQAVKIIRDGGVIVFPTDSAYSMGCRLGDQEAIERIRYIRQLDLNHHFTLMCRDLSELGTYAIVDNFAFRILKTHTPGAYTFILKASKEVPRRLLHPKRLTIGLRIPDHKIPLALIEELGEPLMSSTLTLPKQKSPLVDPDEIYDALEKQIDLVIDGGTCGVTPTSVIDLVGENPKVIRVGKGDVSEFE